MSFSINNPFTIFTDLKGEPLENGNIFIGVVNLNPETNPVAVFFDEALTIPAAQPIRTIAGYPSNDGTPANLFVTASDLSITVRDKNNNFVFSNLDANEVLRLTLIDASTLVNIAEMTALLKANLTDGIEVNVSGYLAAGDAGGGRFRFNASSTATADAGLTFITDEGGTGRWERIVESIITSKMFGVVGDGVADDTARSQALLDANLKHFAFSPVIHKLTSGLTFQGAPSTHPLTGETIVERYGAVFNIEHTGIGFQWGVSNARSFRIGVYGGSVVRTSAGVAIQDYTPGGIGEEFINTDYCKHFDYNINGFHKGVAITAINGQGQSYLESRPNSILDCLHLVYMTHSDTAFCNENMITGQGSLSYSSAGLDASSSQGAIFMSPQPGSASGMNNNKIYGVSLECALLDPKKPERAIFNDQSYGFVSAPRIEGFETPANNGQYIEFADIVPGLGSRSSVMIGGRGVETRNVQGITRVTVIGGETKQISGSAFLDAGSGATGTAVLTSDAVTSVTVDTAGSAFVIPPKVTFTGGGGTGARGIAVLSGNTVASITMFEGGSGFTSAPTVTISAEFFPINTTQSRNSSAATALQQYKNSNNDIVGQIDADGGHSVGIGGAFKTKEVRGQAEIDLDGAGASPFGFNIPVIGAAVGDFADAAMSSYPGGANWEIDATATSSNIVRVFVRNNGTPISGTTIVTVTAIAMRYR